MAVGNQPDVGGLNADLGNVAVSLRDAAFGAQKLWAYVAALGADQAAQQAGLLARGFTSDDAQAFWVKANNAYAVAQVYYGRIAQPDPYDFDSALALVRGGA